MRRRSRPRPTLASAESARTERRQRPTHGGVRTIGMLGPLFSNPCTMSSARRWNRLISPHGLSHVPRSAWSLAEVADPPPGRGPRVTAAAVVGRQDGTAAVSCSERAGARVRCEGQTYRVSVTPIRLTTSRPRASLLPAATEIVCALDAGHLLVGISHECDSPKSILDRPRVTWTPMRPAATSAAIDVEARAGIGAVAVIETTDHNSTS